MSLFRCIHCGRGRDENGVDHCTCSEQECRDYVEAWDRMEKEAMQEYDTRRPVSSDWLRESGPPSMTVTQEQWIDEAMNDG